MTSAYPRHTLNESLESWSQPELHEVVIVGAGFSGIGSAIALRAAGMEDFLILEQASAIGGTWRDNTYPGIAVDITSFSYSFSFEQNPHWSRVFAPGHELQAYAQHCVDKYELAPHIRLGVRVNCMRFDDRSNTWLIDVDGRAPVAARFVIAASGGLTQPKLPDIEGLDTFTGKVMHTARWDHDHDLAGERVALIGTGASAIQVVPAIAPEVEHLSVFQRTAIWILPKPDAAIPGWLRRLFASVPLSQRAVRLTGSAISEAVLVLGLVYNRQLPFIVNGFEKLSRSHLRRQVADPDVREALTPQYPFGCKRPSFSNEYWQSFNRESVALVTAPIERITATGILTCDGREHTVDTLVLATGFKVFERGNTPPFEVFGVDGTELGAFWDEHRYQAYEGASVPRFPNMFHVLGPYSLTGSSWFSMVEAKTAHIVRCIEEARRRGATRVEIRQDAHDRYFADILRRQRSTVFFNADCTDAHSYYFDHHGDAPLLRPSTGLEMSWRSRHFNLDDYEFGPKPANVRSVGSHR